MISEAHHISPISLADAALELIWPTRCAGCERSGQLLCSACAAALSVIDKATACPRCGAPYGQLICTECYSGAGREDHVFTQAVCALTFDELSGRMIVLYKDNNERRLSTVLANLLLEALPESWSSWVDLLTWVPADSKAFRRRGFDHMERIATELAGHTGLPLEQLLNKRVCRDQRSLNRQQRLHNLAESFTLVHELPSLPPHILLLDDVFTTGSTLDAAASRLIEGGAREVRVASIARAW